MKCDSDLYENRFMQCDKAYLINLPRPLHQALKIRAAQQGIPMRTLILAALFDAFLKDKENETDIPIHQPIETD